MATINVSDSISPSDSPNLFFPVFDQHSNFAYSLVATAPSPASTGTTLTVTTGDGVKFPTPPFNATVWSSGANPLTSNAEIVRVTGTNGTNGVNGDQFTIVRQTTTEQVNQRRSILAGDQIANTTSQKVFTDIETLQNNTTYANQVQPYTINTGTTGNYFYMNLGGIKLFWGTVTNATGSAVGASNSITFPSGFFNTVQTCQLTIGPNATYNGQTANIAGGGFTTSGLTFNVTATAGTAAESVQVFIIGT